MDILFSKTSGLGGQQVWTNPPSQPFDGWNVFYFAGFSDQDLAVDLIWTDSESSAVTNDHIVIQRGAWTLVQHSDLQPPPSGGTLSVLIRNLGHPRPNSICFASVFQVGRPTPPPLSLKKRVSIADPPSQTMRPSSPNAPPLDPPKRRWFGKKASSPQTPSLPGLILPGQLLIGGPGNTITALPRGEIGERLVMGSSGPYWASQITGSLE